MPMKIWRQLLSFLTKIFKRPTLDSGPNAINLFSRHLERAVYLDIFLPPYQHKPWSLLLINDGQDGKALSLKRHFNEFRAKHPLLLVGVHAADRMQEYGTAQSLDYKGRGKKSLAYQNFIIKELLPFLHKNYPIIADPRRVGIAGFSLGALSAIDLAWRYPKVFGICGVFSGALWWRSKSFNPLDPDANRIIHEQVKKSAFRQQRFWFQAGTLDELEDRNKNGIIDAIDDTLQLMEILKDKIPKGNHHLEYVEVENGEHHPKTWGSVLPKFLSWAYGSN